MKKKKDYIWNKLSTQMKMLDLQYDNHRPIHEFAIPELTRKITSLPLTQEKQYKYIEKVFMPEL